jgi:hypothetical protein
MIANKMGRTLTHHIGLHKTTSCLFKNVSLLQIQNNKSCFHKMKYSIQDIYFFIVTK